MLNNEDAPIIVNANEPHMALLFLLDTSGSMMGERIDELNKGLNRFKEKVCEDEKTKAILDVAIIEFNNNYKVIQDFMPVEYMDKVNLSANGSTYLKDALNKAIQLVDERSKFYRLNGAEPYKPWIILVSDGEPFDQVEDLVTPIQKMVEKEKLAFWSLAVPGANTELLHKLSGKRVLNLKDYDFVGFFDWVNKSMRAVSCSSPGDKPRGQELPATISIDDLM